MLINVNILLRYKNKKNHWNIRKKIKETEYCADYGTQYIENEWSSYVNWQA